MLKRQDSLLSSSRRQAQPPPQKHHAKSVGCMSGIFHLVSKYQNRHKLLTFRRKHEKKATSTQSSIKEENYKLVILDNVRNFDSSERLSSKMVQRSPVLSQKIRLSNACNLPEQLSKPPALVARLMGLEEQPVVARNRLVEEESTEEKRQRLLQALEKCNEDLEALKKIIKAVQSSEKDLQSPSLVENIFNQLKSDQAQSPNSPLKNYNKLHANGVVQQQSKKMMGKRPGEDDDGIGNICFLKSVLTESLRRKRRPTATPSFWSSKAMIQSVDEVCNDIAWGEEREVGNIGLMIQNEILKDLIQEIVKDLSYHFMYQLPLEACKRRLSY